jgi:hypothetical protein
MAVPKGENERALGTAQVIERLAVHDTKAPGSAKHVQKTPPQEEHRPRTP